MRTPHLASATAAVLAAGVLAIAQPAAADDGIRHVNSTAETCTDTGTGTTEAPFCTVAAAVAGAEAGQTVAIRGGRYDERVTVTGSGTATQPITIRFATGSLLYGENAGFVVDGGRHIRFENLQVQMESEDYLAFTQPLLDLRDASAVTVDGGRLHMAATEPPSAPVVRLSGVTDSLLTKLTLDGTQLVNGLTMDADTQRVTVDSLKVAQMGAHLVPAGSPAIRIAGAGNTVVNSNVGRYRGAAILLEPTASATVLANNVIHYGGSHGIHNSGASGTAITNNTITWVCGDGIRVDGASSGVSVQNNMLHNAYRSMDFCDPADRGKEVEIRVQDEAVADTVVDYNNAYDDVRTSPKLYAWAGTQMSLAGFRNASGQAAHDRETTPDDPTAIDSANSAAPGFQETDRNGAARADDRATPDTGAGPITYADRGATERHIAPSLQGVVALDISRNSVTADASASAPRTSPITSYTFAFGDGTVVDQVSPVASHRYSTAGEYTVSITVTTADGRTNTISQRVSMLPRIAALGLLTKEFRTYVTLQRSRNYLVATSERLTADGHFELLDAGSGHVALLSTAAGRYLSVDPSFHNGVVATKTSVGSPERFTLIRNSDGTISLRSVANGNYLAMGGMLAATATTISVRERLYQAAVSGPPFAALKATKAPSVSGTLRVGSTVKANPGTWTPSATSYAYQWYANGTAIKDATDQSLKITSSMLGKRLTVRVTAKLVTHPSGTATSASSAKIARGVAPKATKKPTINGTIKAGRTVKAKVGAWSPKADSYKYVWRVNGKVVKNTTKSKHLKLKSSWRGKKLTVTVIAIRAGHSNGTATSKAVTIRR